MGRLLRTFVALRCGPAVCRTLRRTADGLARLERLFRAPRTDDFHLTLHFLGDTAEEDLPALGRALVAAAAALPGPLAVRYGPLGAFPSPERARVVWARVREAEGEEGSLAGLAGAVGRELGALGYPPEARALHPHVTLGRLRGRPGARLVEAVEAGAEADLGGEVLSDLKLILSDPGEGQYHYIDLTSVPLGGDGG